VKSTDYVAPHLTYFEQQMIFNSAIRNVQSGSPSVCIDIRRLLQAALSIGQFPLLILRDANIFLSGFDFAFGSRFGRNSLCK